MVDWLYLIFSQYPAFLLLALLFFFNYLLARKSSAVKSMIWVLLFAVALVCTAVSVIMGVQQEYWKLSTLFPLSVASWIGVVVVFVLFIVHIVHTIEKKHNKRVMEKELKKAEKAKEDAVAQAREEGLEAARQAHEEGRIAARQEVEAERLSSAAVAAEAEAAASAFGEAVQTPIELTLDGPVQGASSDLPKFNPETGLPYGQEPPAPKFDPETGLPYGQEPPAPKFDSETGLPINPSES